MRAASLLLGVAAVALVWLAFTQFGGVAPQPGSPGSRAYEDAMVRAAQRSVLLGLASGLALLGAFACHQRAGQRQARVPDPP